MESKTQLSHDFAGFLYGHSGPVTSIVTGHNAASNSDDTTLVSGSRDKSLIIWNLTEKNADNKTFGIPFKCLTGHNHFVTDLDITSDDTHVISSSWDGTLRLWDIRYAKCIRKFIKPEGEIETVCFSTDNCRIFSGGHDKFLSLWNVKAQRKATSDDKYNHRQWITKVRYSASQKNEYYATVGRDGRLKIWTENLQCIASIKAHDNCVNALALSLNGQYIVTGGKDNSVKVWDFSDLEKPVVEYKTESEINALAFNIQYQLVAAATDKNVKIWDINNKSGNATATIELEPVPAEGDKPAKKAPVRATSIAWSNNLRKLYVGCSDGNIRVYNINLSGN